MIWTIASNFTTKATTATTDTTGTSATTDTRDTSTPSESNGPVYKPHPQFLAQNLYVM